MSEQVVISKGAINRKQRYEELLPQLEALVSAEQDWIANTSNIFAALKEALGFFWIGCYRVQENELVLGPFQGTVACTRIALGKGVCGTSWKENRTLIVPDVDLFPGHIACSTLSKSEIVVPVRINQKIVMVIDVDSISANDFDQTDAFYLEKIAEIIAGYYDEE